MYVDTSQGITIVGDFNYQTTNGQVQIDTPQELSITALKQFPEFGNSEGIMGPPEARLWTLQSVSPQID